MGSFETSQTCLLFVCLFIVVFVCLFCVCVKGVPYREGVVMVLEIGILNC
jgi:hypothetical protein